MKNSHSATSTSRRKPSSVSKGGRHIPATGFAPAHEAAARISAAQDAVRAALIQFLADYDPYDDAHFGYAVSQSMNLIGNIESVAALIGVSQATMHRWAGGASTPMPAARAAIVALFRRMLEDGLEAILSNKAASLRASANEAQEKLVGAFASANESA